MSLVLSNAFKGLLLSSYVNIRFDLAVKSWRDLIDKPSINIIHDNASLHFIKVVFKRKTNEIIKLLKIPGLETTGTIDVLTKNKDIVKFRSGQTAIICNSINCPVYIAINPHLQFVYTHDHQFHAFATLAVAKYHSHSKQICKL